MTADEKGAEKQRKIIAYRACCCFWVTHKTVRRTSRKKVTRRLLKYTQFWFRGGAAEGKEEAATHSRAEQRAQCPQIPSAAGECVRA